MKILYEEVERGVFYRRRIEEDGTSYITRRNMDKHTAMLHFNAESTAAKINGERLDIRMRFLPKEKGQ